MSEITKEQEELFARVAQILEAARGQVARTVNTAMVHAYWLVGRGDRRGRAGGGGACGVRRGAHRTIGRASTRKRNRPLVSHDVGGVRERGPDLLDRHAVGRCHDLERVSRRDGIDEHRNGHACPANHGGATLNVEIDRDGFVPAHDVSVAER